MTEVPDLRIVDEELWQAVKARQENIAVQYADVIEATRSAHKALNRTHRPKSLLSGLVYCGCCGGPYSLRGQERFACSNHVDTKSCSNGHSITRDKLESRVLDGLRDRMMTPEVAAEAIRTYVDESNRINHQRRASEIADRTDLQKVLKAINGLVTLAKEGKGTRALVDELLESEAQEDALRARLAAAPVDVPDIHPNISEIYRRKVERRKRGLRTAVQAASAIT